MARRPIKVVVAEKIEAFKADRARMKKIREAGKASGYSEYPRGVGYYDNNYNKEEKER